MPVKLNSAGGGSITLSVGATSSTFTQTLPNASGTIALTSDITGGGFSGSYNDLTNKPSLFSGSYNDLTSKPSLFSGSYNDLSDKPATTIPTDLGGVGTYALLEWSGSNYYDVLAPGETASGSVLAYTSANYYLAAPIRPVGTWKVMGRVGFHVGACCMNFPISLFLRIA